MTEEELAFYDFLYSKIGTMESSDKIKNVVKDIVNSLGPYVKVADWKNKDSIRARIRLIVKTSLMKMVDTKMSYREIDSIANEMLNHIETVYSMAA